LKRTRMGPSSHLNSRVASRDRLPSTFPDVWLGLGEVHRAKRGAAGRTVSRWPTPAPIPEESRCDQVVAPSAGGSKSPRIFAVAGAAVVVASNSVEPRGIHWPERCAGRMDLHSGTWAYVGCGHAACVEKGDLFPRAIELAASSGPAAGPDAHDLSPTQRNRRWPGCSTSGVA